MRFATAVYRSLWPLRRQIRSDLNVSSPTGNLMSIQYQDAPTTNETSTVRQSMQAIVFDDYGDASVLHRAEVTIPQRGAGQVLIAVEASSVNPIDYRIRRGEMKGLLPFGFPRVPGYDVAGIVVQSDGDGAFQPGDRVMAYLDNIRGGACAQFAVCGENVTAKIPDSMAFETAAAIPLAGTTALQSLRDHGKIAAGQHVLINGASGGVGMFALQIAKSYACHVTAVASGENESFCRSLGADDFIDYQQTDFTKTNNRWDLVFDVSGKASYRDACKVMNSGGHFVSTEPDVKGIAMSLLTWPLSKPGRVMLAKPCGDDLRALIDLHQQGKLEVTIDGRFPLTEAADAHRRVENGVDRGKVVILGE